MSLNTMKGPTQKILGAGKNLALALILCFSFVEAHGQSYQSPPSTRTTKTVKSMADTLQEGGGNIDFTEPQKINKFNISCMGHTVMDSINDSIERTTRGKNIKIDFTKFKHFNSNEVIINEVMITIHEQGKIIYYTFTIGGRGVYMDIDDHEKILPLLERMVDQIPTNENSPTD